MKTRKKMMAFTLCAMTGLGAAPFAVADNDESAAQRVEAREGAQRQAADAAATAREHRRHTKADLVMAKDILGKKVRNLQEKELGHIQEIVVDIGDPKIAYAVVASGGFLDLGEKYFAVPWSSLQTSADARVMVLDADKKTFESAKGFDKDNWPNMADPQWIRNTDKAFSSEQREPDARANRDKAPKIEPTKKMWVNRLSKLDGLTVQNRDNEDLGSVDNFVVDTREGRIAYAVISTGGVLGIGDKLTTVPIGAIELDRKKEVFVIDTTADALKSYAFTKNDWPDMKNEEWARSTHAAFKQNPYWEVFGYKVYFDVDKKRTAVIKGIVTEFDRTNADHVWLTLLTDKGKKYTVQLGEQSQLAQALRDIKPDDRIAVKVRKDTVKEEVINHSDVYEIHTGDKPIKINDVPQSEKDKANQREAKANERSSQ